MYTSKVFLNRNARLWTCYVTHATIREILFSERFVMQEIIFKRVHPDAVIPEYKTPGAAGFDIGLIEHVEIAPRSIVKVPTGLIVKTPSDHVLMIASRGSNAMKKGIGLPNSIGVIDSDFAGPEDEIFLILENLTQQPVQLQKGDRVAQGMFIPVTRGDFREVEEMPHPNRGGHGSTGR